MPESPPEKTKPQDRQTAAQKKPVSSAKTKSADKEARLAEALRANLRRRKDKTADRKED